eukprot:scaffold2161_cov244-Pinguiococcus_pyrenoidosus.AAC.1
MAHGARNTARSVASRAVEILVALVYLGRDHAFFWAVEAGNAHRAFVNIPQARSIRVRSGRAWIGQSGRVGAEEALRADAK